jgi:hypothetical protein
VQHFVENLLKVLKVLKTIKGRPTSETKRLRHALRTAHRAYRMTFNGWNSETSSKIKKPIEIFQKYDIINYRKDGENHEAHIRTPETGQRRKQENRQKAVRRAKKGKTNRKRIRKKKPRTIHI